MATDNQNFSKPSAGSSDWDTGLNPNFDTIERGYHIRASAGIDIKTGHVVWINSGGFAFPFNPNSESLTFPHAFSYRSVASGEQAMFLRRGIVNSLDILSPCVPGRSAFVSASTPGVVVGSYSGAWPPIGFGAGPGLLFDPAGAHAFPEKLTLTTTVVVGTGTVANFTLDPGKRGWARKLQLIGNSADLLRCRFWSGSARVGSELLYETKSGGIAVVGSFIDQAGWPYENTYTSSLYGTIYGSLDIQTGCAVNTDTVAVTLIAERSR